MDKRIVVATLLSVGVLFAWSKFFGPSTTPPSPPPAPTPVTGKSDSAAAEPKPGAGAPAATGTPEAAASPVRKRGPEQEVTLESPKAAFVFSTWGGTLRHLRLKDNKFLLDKKDPRSGQDVVRAQGADLAPLKIGFARAEFPWPADLAWDVQRPTDDAVVFSAETDAVRVEKRYHLVADYQLALDVRVTNKSDQAQRHELAVYLYGSQDPERKGGGFFDYASANLAEMVCFANDKVERHAIEPLGKKPFDVSGKVTWAAADEKFVTLALVTSPQVPGDRCALRAVDGSTGEVLVSFAAKTIEPGASAAYPLIVFGGPKYREALSAVQPGGQDVELERLVNVTFAVLSRPMLGLLKVFQRVVGNWGLAIILLTIFVKLVTFYPAHRALMSGKKMARLAPKIAELRKKYENDRERLAKETMALYKTNGVNMFGGCLPSLIQMPIWIALFSTLNYSVELYRAPFFLYIHDLSARDPFFITPLLMGAVMTIQMRMSPAGADPQQQKMMAIMMPIMFTGFSLFLPAGLAIYTLTSYLLGIVHQLIVNRIDARSGSGALPAGKPAKA